MTPIQQLMLGVGASKKTYLDDVFSTQLWTGNSTSPRTITTGFDMSSDGGMVWIKKRNSATESDHIIGGTGLSDNNYLSSNSHAAKTGHAGRFRSLTSTGFEIGSSGYVNETHTYSSWAFKQAPGFFDVVTYTGNGTAGRTVSHSLGSVPGMIMTKCTSEGGTNWAVYHRELGETKQLFLDNTEAAATSSIHWNDTAPTSSVFSVGTSGTTNGNGKTYIAYLFAHNVQSFGDSEKEIVKCDSYTGNGSSGGPVINLGWEPQWIMVKRTDSTGLWTIFDSIRGIPVDGNARRLYANTDDDEEENNSWLEVTNTGFKVMTTAHNMNASGGTYVYMAIRRADGYVGKPPSAGTDVFAMSNADSTPPAFNSGFPVDFVTYRQPGSNEDWYTAARMTGLPFMRLNLTNLESTSSDQHFYYNDGFNSGTGYGSSYQGWLWKRHAGFDVVTYKGNGTAGHQISHNLSKSPEMMWVKCREDTTHWAVYHKGFNGGTTPQNYYAKLNENQAESSTPGVWNNTAPTATSFTLGTSGMTNGAGNLRYLAMLFASVDGISKVGYYDGSASTQTITTGFQPRFVILKSATTAHDWYVLDTTRGWGSGNDNFLALNTNAAQVSHDFGAPTSTGFTLTTDGTYNSSGQKYIYYAHA